MPIYSTLKNEESLKQVLVGKETVTGTFATPTDRWYGDVQITRQRPLNTRPERRRSRDGMRNPKFGVVSYSGTYSDDLAFETAPEYLQFGIHVAPAGVSDSESTPGYTYTYEPDDTFPSSFSLEHFVEGLPRRAAGLQFNEITIGADVGNADGNWTFSGSLVITSDAMRTPTAGTATGGSTTTIVDSGAPWTSNSEQGKYVRINDAGDASIEGVIRQIASNTTTTLTLDQALPAAAASGDTFEIMPLMTTGVADRTLNYIPTQGTELTIAGYPISDKLISFSTVLLNNIRSKRFLNNIGVNSAKRGYGDRVQTLTMVLEFDDWNDYLNYESDFPVEQEVIISNDNGPTIDSGAGTKHEATITMPRVVWNSMDPNQNRDGNITVGVDGYCYYDSTDGIAQFAFKNTLSALAL